MRDNYLTSQIILTHLGEQTSLDTLDANIGRKLGPLITLWITEGYTLQQLIESSKF